jgi:hypothetical protein
MDFYELLSQVIQLLQREGRVSYRVLKRQFGLDEDFIEDLKEELVYSKRLAADEDGRVLVWTGESGTTPEAATQGSQITQSPDPQAAPSTAGRWRRGRVVAESTSTLTSQKGQIDF